MHTFTSDMDIYKSKVDQIFYSKLNRKLLEDNYSYKYITTLDECNIVGNLLLTDLNIKFPGYLGVDMEFVCWKPELNIEKDKFENTIPYKIKRTIHNDLGPFVRLIQIACDQFCAIFDCFYLVKKTDTVNVFPQILLDLLFKKNHNEINIVRCGFAFHSDIAVFSKSFILNDSQLNSDILLSAKIHIKCEHDFEKWWKSCLSSQDDPFIHFGEKLLRGLYWTESKKQINGLNKLTYELWSVCNQPRSKILALMLGDESQSYLKMDSKGLGTLGNVIKIVTAKHFDKTIQKYNFHQSYLENKVLQYSANDARAVLELSLYFNMYTGSFFTEE